MAVQERNSAGISKTLTVVDMVEMGVVRSAEAELEASRAVVVRTSASRRLEAVAAEQPRGDYRQQQYAEDRRLAYGDMEIS